jgi:restriction system protein
MLPLLKRLADGGEHKFSALVGELGADFRLTEEELSELLPSGTQPIFANRVGWARLYLKKAGLLDAPKRGFLQITGDQGIDGIIKEDCLGLGVIYVQAKRWEQVIGRPEVQRFAGALAGQHATKGIFITTSSFTDEALRYASTLCD